MNNYPAPREIPAGKILLAEYGDYGEAERPAHETHARAYSHKVRAEVYLDWSSPGFEPAGSVARWTNGYWRVVWRAADGALHGQRYLPNDEGEAKAREHFAKLTA